MRSRFSALWLYLPALVLIGPRVAAEERPLLGIVTVHRLTFNDLAFAPGSIPPGMQKALAVGFVQTAPLPATPRMLALAVGNAASPVSLAGRSWSINPAEDRRSDGEPIPGWLGANLQIAGLPVRLYLPQGCSSVFHPFLAGTDGSAGRIGIQTGPPPAWFWGDFPDGLAVFEMPPGAGAMEIRNLLESLSADFDGLWILGLTPGPGSMLPCARWWPGRPGGTLLSTSTRTAGFLVPADLTADLAAALRLAKPPLGKPLLVRQGAKRETLALALRFARAAAGRRGLMVVMGGMLFGGSIILGLLVLAGRWPAARFALGSLMALPGAFALVPADLGAASPAIALALSLALAGLAVLLCRERGPLIAGGLTALLLLGDLAAGSSLGRLAVLGFAPYLGYRYYGLGNEAMALVIGGGLITLGAWPAEPRRAGNWLIMLLALLVSHPLLGANVGGGLTALLALGAWWAAEGDVSRLWLLPPVALLLGFLNYATEFLVGRTSHFGAALAGRMPQNLYPLLQAKLWSMARVMANPLSWLALAALAAFIYLSFRHFVTVLGRYPHLRRAIGCAMVAAVGGSLLNDSAAAVGALLAWPALAAWFWALIRTGSLSV